MKVCNHCRQEKPESEFSPARGYHGGLNARCKQCRREICLKWYYSHQGIVAERNKKKYWADPEIARAKSLIVAKRWYHNHKEEANAKSRESWIRNLDRYRKIARECARRYRAEGRVNKENAKAAQRKYADKYPERVKATKNNNLSRRRATPGQVTAKQWKQIILFYGRACAICHIPESEVPLTVDHFIPISKGGTNYWYNVWPLCLSCNSRKHDKVPTELQPPHVMILRRTGTFD